MQANEPLCIQGWDCKTYNDSLGDHPSVNEIDARSGLCAACVIDRAASAIDSCAPEDEARDGRALDVLSKVLADDGAWLRDEFRRAIVRLNREARELALKSKKAPTQAGEAVQS